MNSTLRSATPLRVHQFWNAIDQCSANTQDPVDFERIITIVTSFDKVSREELKQELEAAVRDELIVSEALQTPKGDEIEIYKLPEQEMTKPDHDWYCFHCHLGAGGPAVPCGNCPRIFHLDCLPDDRKPDKDLFVCQCCHVMTTKPSAELSDLKPKQLNKLLEYSCRRLKDWGIPKLNSADGKTWAIASYREAKDEWRCNLLVYFNIDLSQMMEKVVGCKYQSLEEFQVDCETLMHGIRVYFEQPQEEDIAAIFLKEVMKDLQEIKLCPDCFRRSNEKQEMNPWWFCLPCKTPHQVVWAKQSGYPYWPAKVMKIFANGSKYDVRYFGGNHERGIIDVKNIQPIDTPLSSLKIRKSTAWNEAYEELEQFLDLAKNPEKINSLPATKAKASTSKSKETTGKRAASSNVEEKVVKKSRNEKRVQKSTGFQLNNNNNSSPASSSRVNEVNPSQKKQITSPVLARGETNQSPISASTVNNLSDDNMSSHVESESNSNMSSHGYKLRSKDPPVLEEEDADDDTNSIPHRCQQPPAYINTNLGKVKIESDYVPVVAIKPEPDQDLNQVEIEHENNDNNNKNGHGNESKDNETLEEDFDQYAKKVISLSHKTTKLQTAVKNKMHQSKMVIEGLETKICDLNSTIIQQKDENNQLNSQVAEQQKQIQELQNKLKLLVETSKIGDLPTKVLSSIFDYLDIKSLKESRLVCRLWRHEGGKVLLHNFYLIFDASPKLYMILPRFPKEKCEKSLRTLLTCSDSKTKETAQKLLAKDAGQTLTLLGKVESLRSSVKELKLLTDMTGTWHTKYLDEILKLLPNLKVLETNALNLNPNQSGFFRDITGLYPKLKNQNPINHKLLLEKFQTLEKLKLNFPMDKETASHILSHHQKFVSFKNIEILDGGTNFANHFLPLGQNPNRDFIGDYMSKSLHNWTITRFTLDVQKNYNVGLIRRFLLKISPSLKHLKFVLKDVYLSCFDPWRDNWIIPIGLNRLETLKIMGRSSEFFLTTSILVALRLPQLKKLVVEDIPLELEEIINKWNSHESAKGRKLSSESLEELELGRFANPIKIPENPWPRLKSLKCEWEIPESVQYPTFLSELRNLERLTVKFAKRYNNKINYNQNPSEFQLRDLKNLKYFYLEGWENNSVIQDIGNFLVQNDLKFMKSLQCVQFHRVAIDAEPLKSALGPNVAIIQFNYSKNI